MKNDEILTVKGNGRPAQDNAPAGPQDDRKRRTPGRKGRPGVESAQSGNYGIFEMNL